MPASATAVEGGSAVAVCVEMNSTSEAATLAKNVVVTLSTVDGTGMYVQDIFIRKHCHSHVHKQQLWMVETSLCNLCL